MQGIGILRCQNGVMALQASSQEATWPTAAASVRQWHVAQAAQCTRRCSWHAHGRLHSDWLHSSQLQHGVQTRTPSTQQAAAHLATGAAPVPMLESSAAESTSEAAYDVDAVRPLPVLSLSLLPGPTSSSPSEVMPTKPAAACRLGSPAKLQLGSRCTKWVQMLEVAAVRPSRLR